MAKISELSDQELKIIMTNRLKFLVGKSIRTDVSKEMATLRKDQKEMLEIRNTVTESKTVSHGLISRLGKAEERISELQDVSRYFLN